MGGVVSVNDTLAAEKLKPLDASDIGEDKDAAIAEVKRLREMLAKYAAPAGTIDLLLTLCCLAHETISG